MAERTFSITAAELDAQGLTPGIGNAITWAEANVDPDEWAITDVSAVPKGRYGYADEWSVTFTVEPIETPTTPPTVLAGPDTPVSQTHTIGGQPIDPVTNPGEYGRTHDFKCPGCANTSFTASPRSETYWCS